VVFLCKLTVCIITFTGINPLISKQFLSTALNEKGYKYAIYNAISLQFLQLEIHVSQLSGAKIRTFLSSPDQIFKESGVVNVKKV
jgi:hypothetical protein